MRQQPPAGRRTPEARNSMADVGLAAAFGKRVMIECDVKKIHNITARQVRTNHISATILAGNRRNSLVL
jgi:hypothetical protein